MPARAVINQANNNEETIVNRAMIHFFLYPFKSFYQKIRVDHQQEGNKM